MTAVLPDPRAAEHRAVWAFVPDICSIDDCTHPVQARGWCRTHYSRWKRNGDPTLVLRQSPTPITPEWIEDLEWLIDQGVCPAGISQRFRMSLATIVSRCERAERPDLAARFARYVR